jgi:two-component system LytT family sensor kinase
MSRESTTQLTDGLQHPGARRGWYFYALAWVPAVLLYAMAVSAQPETTWWHGLISGVVVMGAAALMGVGVWWLSGRFPVPSRSYILFAIVHAFAAAAFTFAWLGAMLGWLRLVAPPRVATIVFREAGSWQLISGLYLYAFIAGISYLLRTQKRLRERETAAARAEAAAARAQLQVVRAQLNPHFLFNALHAVSSLVRTDPPAADRAIERLGELLRHSLDHSARELVPLGQEWEFVKGYLDLEQLRLGDRLKVEIQLDPLALDVLVPPFLLQPLVENAVRHGIAASPQGGTIQLSAQRTNGTIALRIVNDGPVASASTGGTGLGLDGVRQQIESRYGRRGSLQVDTTRKQGFAVTVTLPIAADDA